MGHYHFRVFFMYFYVDCCMKYAPIYRIGHRRQQDYFLRLVYHILSMVIQPFGTWIKSLLLLLFWR